MTSKQWLTKLEDWQFCTDDVRVFTVYPVFTWILDDMHKLEIKIVQFELNEYLAEEKLASTKDTLITALNKISDLHTVGVLREVE